MTTEILHKPQTRESHQAQFSARGRFCCAICGNPVTSSDNAIVVQGNHFHDCTNPDGHRFLVVCFSSAVGCHTDGDLTGRFSWFTGYRWQFSRCRGCDNQLGWHYVGAMEFDGLMLEMLVECPQSDSTD